MRKLRITRTRSETFVWELTPDAESDLEDFLDTMGYDTVPSAGVVARFTDKDEDSDGSLFRWIAGHRAEYIETPGRIVFEILPGEGGP